MKAITKILMFLSAGVMLASCEIIKEDVCPSENTVEITASIAYGQTKTAVQDGETAVYWQSGDEVKIFFDGTGSRFTSLCSDLSRTSKFTGSLNVMFGFDEGFSDDTPLWGLYPYRVDATADNVSVTTTLPSEQIACEGTFAQATNISVARSTGLSMAFYNVCGGVRFKLSTESVTSVTMKSNGGEALAGKVKIGFDDEDHPEILEITEPMSEVTLTCEEGFKADAWYYIVTLPGTLSGGVTFTMQTDSLKATKVIDRSLTVKRSVFGSIASLDEEVVWKNLNLPEPNQVFYTSSDEQTLTSFNGEFFDAGGNKLTLVSNEYSNGKGVMTFSGEVYRIGTRAFYNRPRLVTLTLPEGLRTIDASAITDNIRLDTLTLPESLTKIGEHCFENNAKLTSISSLGSITKLPDYFAYGCSSLVSVDIPEIVTSIGKYAFYGCTDLSSSIVIPEGVTSIADGVFRGCCSLTSINIPDGVTSIGWYAFAGCSSLTSITIPAGVTSIGDVSFSGCSSLGSIVIPEGVSSIPNAAFDGCSSLTSIVIPEGVTFIGPSAFRYCNFTSIVIPEGVASIGSSAFSDCGSLTSIVIPEGVASIGTHAFASCSSLTSIIIPEGITSIQDGTFCRCGSLCSINIPEGVTTIGSLAFFDCCSLPSINIPDGVTFIGNNAFAGCSSLTSIVIPESITSIDYYAFARCSSLTSIVIPKGLDSIGWRMFDSCSSLISIDIPDGVSIIAEGAFSGCSSLTSITIPESVTSINDYAFEDCSKLSVFNCRPSVPPTLGMRAFRYCSALSRINVPVESVDAYKNAQVWSDYSNIIMSTAPEMVDLGLSVKWASCNLGASTPDEYGDYYAWAATEPWYESGYALEKPQQHWKTGKTEGYRFVNTPYQTVDTGNSSLTKWTKYLKSTASPYKDASATDEDALKKVLDPEDDAAHVILGGNWRIPTDAEWTELKNNCTWTWTDDYEGTGISGKIVTSKKPGYTDRSIFLPAAGLYSGITTPTPSSSGRYWSSSLYGAVDGYYMLFDSTSNVNSQTSRNYGQSIRPVSD